MNIWCWPIGSGEVYGYRTDATMPPAVRAGVTPKRNADRDIGAWNAFEITMRGDRLTVVLNGEEVISARELPGCRRRADRSRCSTTARKETASGPARRASSSSATSPSRSCSALQMR